MIPRPFSHQKGFTLLELILVMVIIAVSMGLVLPRLPDIAGMKIDRGARKIGMIIKLTRERAVALRRYYRLEIDFDASTLTASYFGPENIYVEDEDLRVLELPESVRITDIVTAGGGKDAEGSAWIHFSPKGMIEPSAIHLTDNSDQVKTVQPGVLNGSIRIEDGYVEFPTL